jgi:hypothetical protein
MSFVSRPTDMAACSDGLVILYSCIKLGRDTGSAIAIKKS